MDTRSQGVSDSLPHPLSDPLRVYRRLFRYLLLPVFGLSLAVRLLLPQLDERAPEDAVEAAAFAVTFTLLFCTSVALPSRVTNAVYLRSFRNDESTGDLRTAVQRALGPAFRLSGIRDPRRRWHWLARHLLYILFLLRYAQPKYMNLEAGDDWKARLWRSLGDARCAVIDVTDLTAFVAEEIELAVECMGVERVLFVGDTSRAADEWRRAVLVALRGAGVSREEVRLAVWEDTPAGRAAFAEQVRAFAAALPAGAPGLNSFTRPTTPPGADKSGNTLRGEGWRALAAATAVGLVIVALQALVNLLLRPPALVSFLPTWVFSSIAAFVLVQYAVVCGSWRKRTRLAVTFLGSAAIAGLPAAASLLPPRPGVRHAAARMSNSNNLTQIGLAMHNYEATHVRPPPQAICRPDGTPLLSWRVLILPHIEEDHLYKQFRLDEPWDSPDNRRLLHQMPRMYQSPYRRLKAPPGGAETDTHYQMVTGAGTFWGEDRPSGRKPRPLGWNTAGFDPPFQLTRLRRPGETILVAEAADPVPWTKPADVAFRPAADRAEPDEMIRRFGATKFGFSVLLADGSVRSFSDSKAVRPEELDRLIVTGEQP